MNQDVDCQGTLVISYMTLRKAIGLMGFLLPFMLVLGDWLIFHQGIQSSISIYYHTGMRDVFVGTLWAMGFFLLSYRGYDRQDDIVANLACIFAVGISLFPTDINPYQITSWVGWVHLALASLFFLCLIYFSLILFTKTSQAREPTPKKRKRNWVYRVCGVTMIVCILLIAIYILIPDTEHLPITSYNPIFWLETFALMAFGISWLTKGEAILKDDLSSASKPAPLPVP